MTRAHIYSSAVTSYLILTELFHLLFLILGVYGCNYVYCSQYFFIQPKIYFWQDGGVVNVYFTYLSIYFTNILVNIHFLPVSLYLCKPRKSVYYAMQIFFWKGILRMVLGTGWKIGYCPVSYPTRKACTEQNNLFFFENFEFEGQK